MRGGRTSSLSPLPKPNCVGGDGVAQWVERWTQEPKHEGFESRQEQKKKKVFSSQKSECCADLLSVCERNRLYRLLAGNFWLRHQCLETASRLEVAVCGATDLLR